MALSYFNLHRACLCFCLIACTWTGLSSIANAQTIDDFTTQSMNAMRSNNYVAAAPLLTQALEEANKNPDVNDIKHLNLYLQRAYAYERLGQIAKAMEDYSTVITKWSASTEPTVIELVVIGSANLGGLQTQTGQFPQASATYEQALKLWGSRTDRGVLIQMARIYWQYGFLHEKNLQVDSALQIYERAIALYASYSHPLIDIRLVNIHNNKGVLLSQLKRMPEAFAVFDGVVEKYGSKTDPLVIEQIIRAKFNKAFYRYWALGERETAMQEYQAILNQWGTRTEPPISQQIIYVLLQTAGAHELKTNFDEAIKTHEILIQRASTLQTQQAQLSALSSKARIAALLLHQEKYPASLAICQDILNAYGNSTLTLFQVEVVNTLLTKARAQNAQKLPQDAIKTYDFLIEKFSGINNTNISRSIDNAKDERLSATKNAFILQRSFMPRRF